jgi:hypothetical protein
MSWTAFSLSSMELHLMEHGRPVWPIEDILRRFKWPIRRTYVGMYYVHAEYAYIFMRTDVLTLGKIENKSSEMLCRVVW